MPSLVNLKAILKSIKNGRNSVTSYFPAIFSMAMEVYKKHTHSS